MNRAHARPVSSGAGHAAPPRRGERTLRIAWWCVWVVLGVWGACGLPRARISNTLEGWAPGMPASREVAAYVVVGLEPSRSDARAVERDLAQLPSVARCIGPGSSALLRAAGVGGDNPVVNRAGDYAAVYCFGADGVPPAHLAADVRAALAPYAQKGTRFALGGSAAFAAALDEISRRGMPAMLGVMTLAGGLLLWAVTRSIPAACAGVGAISISMLILIGATGWCGVAVDMSILLVPPLMVSLGYSYAAHAALRVEAAPALRICVATSIAGIAAFGVTDVPSIRSFALWGSIGVAMVWLAVLTLMPAPREGSSRGRDRPGRLVVLRTVRRRRWGIVCAGLAVCAAGAGAVPSLRVDPQPLNFFPPGERLVRELSTLERRLTGTLPFEVRAPSSLGLEGLLRRSGVVRTWVRTPSVLAPDQDAYWCLANNDQLERLGPLFHEWDALAKQRGTPISTRGVAPQLLEVRRQMSRVAAVSIPTMLLVAAGATALVARSIRAGLATALAVAAPIALVLLAAALLKLPLGTPALMVGAIGIGAGVDDAIHVAWLRRRGSLARTMRTCLRACVGSSLIAALCIAAFAASPLRPTAQFGLLMGLILALAAAADMLLLPAAWGGGPISGSKPAKAGRRPRALAECIG